MPAKNTFKSFYTSLSDPTSSGFNITPSDSDELSYVTRGVTVTGAGTMKVDFADMGENISVYASPGSPLPIRIKKVYSTGTTATGIVGLF